MSEIDDFYHRKSLKEDAWEDGYRAYVSGKTRDDNPYNNNDEWDLNQASLDGFTDAG